MKQYTKPILEIVAMQSDVILTSDGNKFRGEEIGTTWGWIK